MRSSSARQVWQLRELAERIASFLPANEIPCSLRLLDKAAAALFSGPKNTTVRLSLPSPNHAFTWRWCGPNATNGWPLKRRRHLLSLTAASGSLPNLDVAAAAAGCLLAAVPKVFTSAAAAGQLEVCRRGVAHPEWKLKARPALIAAAGAGQAHVVDWMLEERVSPWTLEAVCAALRGSHVGLAESLLARRPASKHVSRVSAGAPENVPEEDGEQLGSVWGQPGDSSLRASAAGCGLRPLEASYVVEAAARGCSLEVLQRLHSQVAATRPALSAMWCMRDQNLAGAAATSPTPDWRQKLEWLEVVYGGHVRADVCRAVAGMEDLPRVAGAAGPAAAAAAAGDGGLTSGGEPVERLAGLHARGYPMDVRAVLEAAAACPDRLDVLQYLLAEGLLSVRTEDSVVHNAAMAAVCGGGSVGTMAALHALNPRAVEAACTDTYVGRVSYIARRGDAAMLRWMLDRPVVAAELLQWGIMFEKAACSGVLEVMVLLRERGCVWNASAFVGAARKGWGEGLTWLAENGCDMGGEGEAFKGACGVGDLPTLRLLRRLGCSWGSPVSGLRSTFVRCVRVVPEGVVQPVLSWLVAEGCPVDWAAAERAAREHLVDSEEALAWVQQQRVQQQQQ